MKGMPAAAVAGLCATALTACANIQVHTGPATVPPGRGNVVYGPPPASLGPVEPADPPGLPGYAMVGGATGPTPYPLACATTVTPTPAGDVTVAVGSTSDHSVHLRTGQRLVLLAPEACDHFWKLPAPADVDSRILVIVSSSLPPQGAQGVSWEMYKAEGPGHVRLPVSGGCALPYPPPTEPPGIALACDTVLQATFFDVSVS